MKKTEICAPGTPLLFLSGGGYRMHSRRTIRTDEQFRSDRMDGIFFLAGERE